MFSLLSVLKYGRVLPAGLATCAIIAGVFSIGIADENSLWVSNANAQSANVGSANVGSGAYSERQGRVIRVAENGSVATSQYRTAVSSRLTTHLRRTSGDRVFFGPGSSKLGSNARIILSAQARWMKLRPSFGALVSGHADDPGSMEVNKRLARERASVVRQRLIEEGVAPDQIVIETLGRMEPIAVCRSQQCAAQNRRVITRVLNTRPSSVSRPRAPSGNQGQQRVAPHRGAALEIP